MIGNLGLTIEAGVEHHGRRVNRRPNTLVAVWVMDMAAEHPPRLQIKIPKVLIAVVMSTVGRGCACRRRRRCMCNQKIQGPVGILTAPTFHPDAKPAKFDHVAVNAEDSLVSIRSFKIQNPASFRKSICRNPIVMVPGAHHQRRAKLHDPIAHRSGLIGEWNFRKHIEQVPTDREQVVAGASAADPVEPKSVGMKI